MQEITISDLISAIFIAMCCQVMTTAHTPHITNLTYLSSSVCSWLPVLGLLIYDTILVSQDSSKMVYLASFHRCVIQERRHAQPVIFLVIPFIAIIVMYITMAFFLNKSGIRSRKLFMISLAIVLTGLITVLPDSLMMTLGVTLGYQAANIFTIVMYITMAFFLNKSEHFITIFKVQVGLRKTKRYNGTKSNKLTVLMIGSIIKTI
eukprot:sb/3470413/